MISILPLQLMLTPKIGDVFISRFANFVLRNGESEGLRIAYSEKELVSIFGINSSLALSIISARHKAELLLEQLEQQNIGILWLADKLYPSRLKLVLGKETPSVLFYRGNLELLNRHAVGFCGSRKVSETGIYITEKCVTQLVSHEITIVSGYAHGVDITAHHWALRNNGATIIVLAEGILHFREKQEVKELFNPKNHLIVSQFRPAMTWYAHNAMRRNSTIIAISDAMVLIESGLRGGTYAAGKECLHRHRPLFVVDYAMPSNSATGNSEFIKNGAVPIRGKQGIPNLKQLISTICN
jgi:DNA protecting protein DprA